MVYDLIEPYDVHKFLWTLPPMVEVVKSVWNIHTQAFTVKLEPRV